MGKTLVCRCEDVTEHELLEAIARGHRDIESLKRYSGFGTGFCQGKSCLAACAEILEREGGAADLPFTPRPPYHPVSLAHLAGLEGTVAPCEGEGPGER
jgi:bacterioferritin-associated ferredoxin